MMIVQRITAATHPAATELMQRFFQEEGFATGRADIEGNLAQLTADPSCWAALVFRDGEAAGVATVSTTWSVEFGRVGEIGDLYVLPDHRRYGAGTLLIEQAVAWCRSNGAAVVAVTVVPDGDIRHGLGEYYKARRFVPFGRTVLYRRL